MEAAVDHPGGEAAAEGTKKCARRDNGSHVRPRRLGHGADAQRESNDATTYAVREWAYFGIPRRILATKGIAPDGARHDAEADGVRAVGREIPFIRCEDGGTGAYGASDRNQRKYQARIARTTRPLDRVPSEGTERSPRQREGHATGRARWREDTVSCAGRFGTLDRQGHRLR